MAKVNRLSADAQTRSTATHSLRRRLANCFRRKRMLLYTGARSRCSINHEEFAMRSLASILMVVSLSLSVPLAAKTPDADVLSRWVGGKWVSNGEFVDSAFSKAAKAN